MGRISQQALTNYYKILETVQIEREDTAVDGEVEGVGSDANKITGEKRARKKFVRKNVGGKSR